MKRSTPIDLRHACVLPTWKLAELLCCHVSTISRRLAAGDPDLKAAEWRRGYFKVAVLRERGLLIEGLE